MRSMPLGLIEAMLFFGLVLVFACFELWKVRRALRKDAERNSDMANRRAKGGTGTE